MVLLLQKLKVLRKVYHLKGNEKRNLMALVSVAQHLRLGSCERLKLLVIHYCDDLYHARIFESVRTHNSSLEGAMKLKFAPFCSS